MFTKFELSVGLRYLRAKQKNSFVSFISMVSIIGIALGVMALITVLSVMNGFQRDIRNKIIGVTAHMQITSADNKLNHWQQIGDSTLENKHILSYAPYVDGQGLISFDGNVNGIMLRGVEPQFETKVDDLHTSMVKGNFDELQSGKFNIIIGEALAKQLGATIGDKITIITPNGQITPAGMIPRIKQFTISGIFNVHMYEYDSSFAFINIQDAQTLFKMGDSVTGVRLKVDNVMQTQLIKQQLSMNLPETLLVNDWIDQHQNYFSAVQMEKKMMFVVLSLIIAVAAFNLVATLVMTVNDKKADIAIMRTMGASKNSILKIFLIQGGVSGIIGTVSGTILGLLLAENVGKLVHFIELATGSKLISSDVYLIDYLPSQIIFSDVFSIFCISIILSLLATLYPSYRAAKTNPVEALRYE